MKILKWKLSRRQLCGACRRRKFILKRHNAVYLCKPCRDWRPVGWDRKWRRLAHVSPNPWLDNLTIPRPE